MNTLTKNTPQNIKATITGYCGNSRSICWDLDGARFHVWIAPDGRTIQRDIVYKNPPLGTDRHSAMHFDTRKLSASSAAQQRVLSQIWPQVDWNTAKAEYTATKSKEDAEEAARTLRFQQDNQVKKASPNIIRLVGMLELWRLNDEDRIHFGALVPDSESETLDSLIRSIVREMS